MVRVSFTSALKTFFPNLKEEQIEAQDITQLIIALDNKYSGLKAYLVDEKGDIREHVKFYVNNEPLEKGSDDSLLPNAQIHIMQAISGG